jgi:protein-S-isoprenylcysteine O-methyltransferase Ste14
VVILAGSLVVFYFSHRDLIANWSPTLEIRKDHTLITSGIYAFIRHPMYASQLLWVIATPLLMQNWLAGPLYLLFFIPYYFLRVGAEEKMMLDTFGSQYRDYMDKVGGLFPKM